MIPRKQRATDADWRGAIAEIYAQPDHARAERLIEQGRERIERRLQSTSSPALAWSAGKDSIGVEILVEGMGLPSIIALSALEFPEFERIVVRNAPPNLRVHRLHHLDWEWLSEHPRMLFPKTSVGSNTWMEYIQRKGLRDGVRGEGFDLIVMGHRVHDGNNVGQRYDTGAERMDSGGYVRYSPIYDWSHEDLLHVMAYSGRALPEFYDWPRGLRIGTGPWAKRRCESIAQGWQEVDQIDPNLVDTACAWNLPGALDHRRKHP